MKSVVGLCHAIIDTYCEGTDATIKKADLQKGQMNIVTLNEFQKLSKQFQMIFTCPGGSVMNTLDSLCRLGIKGTLISNIGKDVDGANYFENLKLLKLDTKNVNILPDYHTSRSLVIITPDGERTMCTYLGASLNLNSGQVPITAFIEKDAVLIEGYLYDNPITQQAANRAIEVVQSQSLFGVFTLSDSSVAKKHRETMRRGVDNFSMVVGNINEYLAYYNVKTKEELIAAVKDRKQLNCITLGEKGSIMVKAGEVIEIPPYKPSKVMDTTGAGDQYLAGVLMGILRGANLAISGRIGAVMGGSIVEQISATFHRDVNQITQRIKKVQGS